MNPATVPWAICTGIAVAAGGYAVARPWRRLAPRVDPYAVAVRSRLGAPKAEMLALVSPSDPEHGAVAAVLGPIFASLAARFMRLVGHRDEAALALALDRAGIRGVTPRTYAFQQLAYTVAGIVGGFMVGLSRGGQSAVMMSLVSGFFGATWKRNELDRRTTKRTLTMRAELVPVCQMLAVFARAIPNVQSAVAEVVRRGRGEVVGEFARILGLIESGVAPEAAFRRVADLTPEPAAARLYQRLAVALESGGDIVGALLTQATDLNHSFRDDRLARATRRTTSMVGVNATFMLLPIFVLMGAALPSLVVGSLT